MADSRQRPGLRQALFVIGIATLGGCGTSTSVIGPRLEPFQLDRAGGGEFDASSVLGRDVVLLVFWATWCTDCHAELGALSNAYEQERDRGFTLIGISVDGPDTVAAVAGHARIRGWRFPVLLDRETQLVERYNPRGEVPFWILLDRRGRIRGGPAALRRGHAGYVASQVRQLLVDRDR